MAIHCNHKQHSLLFSLGGEAVAAPCYAITFALSMLYITYICIFYKAVEQNHSCDRKKNKNYF